jgi:Domain of unknown function (DUF1918)
MVNVGDRIQLRLNKGADREGVVTAVTGSMLRVRWVSDEETTVIPGPGTLTVLGRAARKGARPRKETTAAPKKAPTKKRPSKTPAPNAAPRTKKAAAKKTSSKRA